MAILAVLTGGIAGAQEPSFEALGQAPIVSGDRVRARERALDEAMRQAVEQAAATLLEPDALVARTSELRLRIYPKARGYVTNYRVLDEGETVGSAAPSFQMHISAQVATARLARDLASNGTTTSLPPSTARGRAVVCATPPGSAAAEQVVRELLAARNVEIAAAPPACSEESAAQAARAAGAQGAVVATVEVTPAGAIRGSDRVAAHAKAHLRLVEPDGRVSGDAEGERDAYDATVEKAGQSAARDAAGDAARGLQSAIVARWPTGSVQGGVRVRVTGFRRYADYLAVTRALAALPGVAAVEPRRFARGEAELVVRTASPAAQLADGLKRLPPPGLRLTAAAPSPEWLAVELSGDSEPQ
ncbi:MAG TPA: flagellar assembly protein T N-terminal domain-containing protein [Polyangia bacterium]|nr:flagellar assembly protein T N-terminal domain-containing protein [Polyangia bacterium]